VAINTPPVDDACVYEILWFGQVYS